VQALIPSGGEQPFDETAEPVEAGANQHRPNTSPVVKISLADIRLGRTPRTQLIDPRHVVLLQACLDELPPIVLHSPDLVLIDGAHRLQATRQAGRRHIAAVLFEGSKAEAFVEAVRRNVAHGKPLTLAERERAAAEILGSQPSTSDRRIAEICGLAADTVGRLRREGGRDETRYRIGRDGRRRPTDPAEGRAAVAALLSAQPDLSDRSAARMSGVSQGTVRDVRRRIALGEQPIPTRMRDPRAPAEPTVPETWVSDSALRSGTEVHEFAQWMDTHCLRNEEWQRWTSAVPVGRLYVLADEARRQARAWEAFANAMEERARRAE
jgi:hypothetical protein